LINIFQRSYLQDARHKSIFTNRALFKIILDSK